jgi:hypothetical protein
MQTEGPNAEPTLPPTGRLLGQWPGQDRVGEWAPCGVAGGGDPRHGPKPDPLDTHALSQSLMDIPDRGEERGFPGWPWDNF